MGHHSLRQDCRAFALCLVLAAAATAHARDVPHDGCVDAQGRAVQEVDDPLLPVLAKAGRERGAAVLRVNTNVMSGAPQRVRLFFLAYECARHALGQPLGAPPTPQQARRADCWALTSLQVSGELEGPAAVQALQAELAFTPEQWRQLPAPQREIDLADCPQRGVLRLPLAGLPSDAQQNSNRCVHGCGDRLWQCQRACTHASCRAQCEAAFDACHARCPAP